MTGGGSYGIRPSDLADDPAAVSGAGRPVPTTPPGLLPGLSASRLFNRWLVTSALVVAAVLVAVEGVPRVGLGTWGESALTLAVGLIGLAAIFRSLGRVGDRKLEEISHGYTTLKLEFGAFWRGEGRQWPQFGRRPPWDYSGLWVLDGATGAVVSEPDRSLDPPGLYPSPNRPGALELWTGVVWSGHYRGQP